MGNKANFRSFNLGDQVSVALLTTISSPTDDSRAFGKVISINSHLLSQYQIITRYSILDCFIQLDNLNPLAATIDIRLPDPLPQNTVTLKQLADEQSMSQKVLVKWDRKRGHRCTKENCARIQTGVKCSVACHSSAGHPDTRTPRANPSVMGDFTSRGLATGDEDN